MRHLNFFSYPDKHYEMTIPHQLSMGGVKNAVLVGVVKMKDEKLYLRSEYSSPTMSFAEAKAWQQRLCEMRANYCGTESGMQTFH